MQIELNNEEKRLIIKGLMAIDTPIFNGELRMNAQKLIRKIVASIPSKD